jgi:protein kinase A
MAVAVLQTMKKHRISNPLHRRLSAKTPIHNEAECQKQRQFIAEYRECGDICEPKQIASDPRNKQLGCSSRSLRVQDFDLMKTLGTGE